jgi:hypothetical protein
VASIRPWLLAVLINHACGLLKSCWQHRPLHECGQCAFLNVVSVDPSLWVWSIALHAALPLQALLGVLTIRAYRKETSFVEASDHLMQENAEAFLTQELASAWHAMRLDFLGLIIVTLTGVGLVTG